VSTAATEAAPLAPAVTLTEKATKQLLRLRDEKAAEGGTGDLVLRLGVRQGGCSGLSYVMEFEEAVNITPEDSVIDNNEGFLLAVDPKSLLYLFGMELDFSDALVGGGFQFHNPSAESTCGCGKSFGV